jgi:hypothetical protein
MMMMMIMMMSMVMMMLVGARSALADIRGLGVPPGWEGDRRAPPAVFVIYTCVHIFACMYVILARSLTSRASDANAIASESSCPHNAHDGICETSSSDGVAGYKDVSDASGLVSALNQQPVSVASQADQAIFQDYNAGTVTSGWGNNLAHGVLAAGYHDLRAELSHASYHGRASVSPLAKQSLC